MSRAASHPTSVNDLTPTAGVRLLLERARDDGASAAYRAAIYSPTASYEGHATLGDDGSVVLDVDSTRDALVMTITA